MPREITIEDIVYQNLHGYPVKWADRLRRWEQVLDLHRRNRSGDCDELTDCIEIIRQRRGEAGIVIAADRLLPMYEEGVPVISDSGLLFGERILPDEIKLWDTIIQPGQAVCLTDVWYNKICPQFSRTDVPGTKDFYPTLGEWNKFWEEFESKLDKVLHQGCHVVLVLTESPFQPNWTNIVNAPLVLVDTTGLPEKAFVTGQYITSQVVVNDLMHRDVLIDPPPAHSYDQLNSERLTEVLPLTAVFDYDPGTKNL